MAFVAEMRIRTTEALYSRDTMSEMEKLSGPKWGAIGTLVNSRLNGWWTVRHDDGSLGIYAEGEFEVLE